MYSTVWERCRFLIRGLVVSSLLYLMDISQGIISGAFHDQRGLQALSE